MFAKKPAVSTSGLALIEKTTPPSLPKSKTKRFGRPEIDLISYASTDSGNAERLVALYGQDIHYCPDYKGWLVWDGKRWKRDRDGRLQRMAKETARRLYAQAMTIQNTKTGDEIGAFARNSESAAGIRAMLECARSVEGVSICSDKFDNNPWILNCLNGTVDLTTGELKAYDRNDLVTKVCPVRFNKGAKHPELDRFVHRIFDKDLELIAYVQRALGYALTGNVGEKAMFCLVGNGNNGKTTLLEAFRYLLGDYAGQILIDSLLQKQNDRSSASLADLADLKGKRFVTTSEAEQGARLAEAQVKQLTGMGMYKACRKYENPVEFPPTWKIFMDSNHRPIVRGKDLGIWTRLKLIPFDVRIPGTEIDRELLQKLKKEAPGLLNWVLAGCLEWQRNGLQEPKAIKGAVSQWRAESDEFRGFFETVCELGPALQCSATELKQAFKRHKETEALDITERQLDIALKRLCCSTGRNKRQRFWRGITVRSKVTE